LVTPIRDVENPFFTLDGSELTGKKKKEKKKKFFLFGAKKVFFFFFFFFLFFGEQFLDRRKAGQGKGIQKRLGQTVR